MIRTFSFDKEHNFIKFIMLDNLAVNAQNVTFVFDAQNPRGKDKRGVLAYVAGIGGGGSDGGRPERGGSERGGPERGGSERGGSERGRSERGGRERSGSERGGRGRGGFDRGGRDRG